MEDLCNTREPTRADSLGADSCDSLGNVIIEGTWVKYTQDLSVISFYDRAAYESIIISIKNAVRKKGKKKKRGQREFLPEITCD